MITVIHREKVMDMSVHPDFDEGKACTYMVELGGVIGCLLVDSNKVGNQIAQQNPRALTVAMMDLWTPTMTMDL